MTTGIIEVIEKIGEADEDASSRAKSKDEVVGISGPESHVDQQNDAEDASIVWDLWCMAQCDSGQGASVCDCDSIP